MPQPKLTSFTGFKGAGKKEASAAAAAPTPTPAPKKKPTPLPWQTLTVTNRHPRDDSIVFDEPTHTYTVNGTYEGWTSCTGFIHDFFPHFNPDAVIAKMMASPKWPQNKYYGMTAEQIKKLWNDNGAAASGAGTAMHLAIEQFMHGHPEVIDPAIYPTPEWRYFEHFWKDMAGDLVPYRSEWEVWSEEHKLAGSIDMVFYRKSDDSYVIYDWKRSKEIKMEAFGDESGYGPVSHLPNVNYWHYTLQLNIYRWFLETFYGLRISDMYLIILHPDNKNYKRFRLNRLEEEVHGMLACRLAAVKAGSKKRVLIEGWDGEHEGGH